MRIVTFCQSLVSDWNHGNAHFLRGVGTELVARGHRVAFFEPCDSWSRLNLVRDQGWKPIQDFNRAYPHLRSTLYRLDQLDLDQALDGAELVLVHEWSDPELVRRVGLHRAGSRRYRLLFHDTHHRSVSAPQEMGRYDLSNYDGVLAFGSVIRDLYLDRGWAQRAWTWHEGADSRTFRPLMIDGHKGDLIWIGNWGDGERTAELSEFLLEPVYRLRLRARAHGVRYPAAARRALDQSGVEYAGWLPNHLAPEAFARFATTVHIPRRWYVTALPGIPTIRVFEALACGIPLISARWEDAEGLFTPGEDFLVARDGREMRSILRETLADPDLRLRIAARGRATLLDRHTCAHRTDELLSIHAELQGGLAA
jgi:spore maturation protein CgeB